MFDSLIFGWKDIMTIVTNMLSFIFPLSAFYRITNKTHKNYIVLCIFLLILISSFHFYQDSFVFTILFHIFSVLAIALSFKDKIRNTMIVYLSMLLCFGVVEGILILIEVFALGWNTADLRGNPYVISVHAFAVGLSTLLVLKKLRISELVQKYQESLQRIIVILLNIPFVIIVFRFLVRNGIFTPKYGLSLAIILLLMFVVINFLAVKIFSDEVSERKLARENEKYIKSMMPIIESLKAEQHDFKNHLHVVKSLISQQDEQAKTSLVDYIKNIEYDSEKYGLTANIDNRILSSIITIKRMTSIHKGIDFVVDLQTTYLPCKDYEQTKLISNLLDNAIESAEQCTGKREIILKSAVVDSKIIYSISNTVDNIADVEIDKMFISKTTTKKDKNKHGYGLMEAKRIVDKYNGSVEVEFEENIISVNISFEAV